MASKKRLFIDLGHTDRFSGASGFRSEVNWNRSILPSLLDALDKNLWDYVLVPTEFENKGGYHVSKDPDDNLRQRIKWINANANSSDFLISIHANAAARNSVRGVTTCYVGGSGVAKIEAIELSTIYSQVTGVPLWLTGEFADTRSRYGRLGMVRDTEPFALLIEAGFVSNKEDMEVNPADAGKAIAHYYNLLADPNYVPLSSQPSNNNTMPVQPQQDVNVHYSSDPDLEESIAVVQSFTIDGKKLIGNVSPDTFGLPLARADAIRIIARLAKVVSGLQDQVGEHVKEINGIRADMNQMIIRMALFEQNISAAPKK